MADSAAQANAIYDPQQASEGSSLAVARDTSNQSLTQQDQQIDPYYNDAIKAAKDARANEGDRQDMLYNEALSGNSSGLQANEQSILGKQLVDTTGKLAGEQAQAHGNIAAQRALVGETYSSGMSALASKYAGLKSQFEIQSQKDAQDAATAQSNANRQFGLDQAKFTEGQREFNQQEADMNAQTAQKNANARDSLQSDVIDSVQSLSKISKPGYTENVIIPKLAAAYKQYGLSTQDVKNAVYNYRKQALGY